MKGASFKCFVHASGPIQVTLAKFLKGSLLNKIHLCNVERQRRLLQMLALNLIPRTPLISKWFRVRVSGDHHLSLNIAKALFRYRAYQKISLTVLIIYIHST